MSFQMNTTRVFRILMPINNCCINLRMQHSSDFEEVDIDNEKFWGYVEESEECIRDLPESITINPTFELTDKQEEIMMLHL